MKLWEVPRDTWVRVVATGDVLLFGRIDGMYSMCVHPERGLVHVMANTEVEIVPPPFPPEELL